jgi:hypothetical protein
MTPFIRFHIAASARIPIAPILPTCVASGPLETYRRACSLSLKGKAIPETWGGERRGDTRVASRDTGKLEGRESKLRTNCWLSAKGLRTDIRIFLVPVALRQCVHHDSHVDRTDRHHRTRRVFARVSTTLSPGTTPNPGDSSQQILFAVDYCLGCRLAFTPVG